MDTLIFTSILSATIIAGTPLIIVALGQLVAEKAGVLNLGAEGMMAMGAIAGFAVTFHTGNPWLGCVAAMFAGALVSLIFAFLTITLLANQVATGLALAIFGVGLSAFIGKPFVSETLTAIAPLRIPYISDIPILGEALYNQQFIVYVSWALFWGVLWFLYKSRQGLVLRSIGESPAVAHAIGYPVLRYRYLAVLFGGAMAGLGGAFMSIFDTPLWSEGMIAGKGWIAIALVVFATWRPFRVVVGAYLFGGVMIVQLFIQGSDLKIDLPSQLLSSLPYLATIIVLVIISRNPLSIRLHSPASLGKPYRPDA
jgi:ABC-type uncharacterized transport system permease subunit